MPNLHLTDGEVVATIVAALAILATLVSWLRSAFASQTAKAALREAKKANELSEQANRHAVEANRIADQALQIQRAANSLVLTVRPEIRQQSAGPWLAAIVSNDGSLEARVTDVALEFVDGSDPLRSGRFDGDIQLTTRPGRTSWLPGTLLPGRTFAFVFGQFGDGSGPAGSSFTRPSPGDRLNRATRVRVTASNQHFYSQDNSEIERFKGLPSV